MREFLNFFDLDYTCSVFDPETNAVSRIVAVLMWPLNSNRIVSGRGMPRAESTC